MRHTRLALAALASLTAIAAGCQNGMKMNWGRDRGALGVDCTILLVEYRGPRARADADRIASELKEQGIKDVFVVAGHEEATVCVGRYESMHDPDARAMLPRVRRIRDRLGQYPFISAVVVPVPEPTPPTDWPLREAPGEFTLQVASWEAPGRKQAATDYADALRRQGHPAYVDHGPQFSIVTVGAFDRSIFRNPEAVDQPDKFRAKITDPAVLSLMERFRHLQVEGRPAEVTEVAPSTGRRTARTLTTGLIRIPGRDAPPPSSDATPVFRIALTAAGEQFDHLRASGLAHSAAGVPALATTLTRQVLGQIPADQGRRIGLLALVPEGDSEAEIQAASVATRAVLAALQADAKATNRVAVDTPEALGFLEAAGLGYADVLTEPGRLADVPSLDLLIVGTVRRQR